MTLIDRFESVLYGQHPHDRAHLRWRLHPDMLDALAREIGIAAPTKAATGVQILGRPVDVDATLRPDAIEYVTGGRLIPRGVAWPPCISCGAPLDEPHAADCRIVSEPDDGIDVAELTAALHAAIDNCEPVGWDDARTTDLRPEAVHAAIDAVIRAHLPTSMAANDG